ncbi:MULTISPECIES: flavin reductase family protein [Streptomyces]|uniref:Pyrimidine utilization flavin reductase protein F n=1 Tax=Streptomyces bangladeshensis TaxID=295352 RepID=A0ABN3BUG9_9ACTN|nr:flavin reductase family protein [Streptomyces sp. FBKL.4005]MYU30599.1 flavin reductase [Streptomyces sp. SID7810]OYP14783.1 flavin reductase [Streptomyces sp. FBKL.4005]CUW31669.1 Flavin reductase (NADPH) [Streptomyces reticuli]
MPPATSTPRHGTGPAPASGADFRTLMAGFPSGVTVITTGDGVTGPSGMTCSAVCSVTPEPPTLVVGIRAESPTLLRVLDTGRFAVNFLHHLGRGTAELFASGDPERFSRVAWDLPDGAAGPHLNEAARSVADCTVTRTVRVGAQRMVFGEIYGIREVEDAPPLLYGLRRYHAWPSTAGNRKESGAPREGGTGSDHG